MSKKYRISLSYTGIGEILKSDEVRQHLQSIADGVVSRCEGNYDTNVYVSDRVGVSITTSDSETYHRNLNNNEILKAL